MTNSGLSRRLEAKVAVVTGATSGIGFAITGRLLADGAMLLVAGLREADVDAALDQMRDTGAPSERLAGFAGDLAQVGVAEACMGRAADVFGGIDVLVNNAGGGVILPTLEHSEESLQATINNNLWTTLRTTLAALPHLVERGAGRIISIGAESVRNGLIDHAVYNAAKGGVHGLTTGLAREFAPQAITVNVVAPSYVRTPELDAAFDAGRAPDRMKQVIDDAINLIPLGRPGETSEVAAAVAWLAGDDAAFVTGQVISVNGGSSML
jgi:2,3-dihydroxy-2,3-dihydro-p-cumate dehydrogenase